MSVFAAFLTSMGVTLFAIPSIMRVAKLKHLYDMPGERKSHDDAVPTLGGMAIFAGMLFSVTFWADQRELAELQYIIASVLILFFVGIKDDLIEIVPWKKLVGQLIAATIIVHFAEIRIYNIFGLFGINDIPVWASYVLTIFTMIVITNSFNLIDGIDTLAGSIGLIVSLTLGTWFLLFQETQFAIWAFALSGSLIAFLWFNKTPARIFMGDTGSLILGFTASILAIQFIEFTRHIPFDHSYKVLSVPVVAVSILIIPLFDTLRVFLIRAYRGVSPFSSDRRHVHHRLVDLGFSHVQATLILCLVNLSFIVGSYLLQGIQGELLLVLVIAFAIFLDASLSLLLRRKP